MLLRWLFSMNWNLDFDYRCFLSRQPYIKHAVTRKRVRRFNVPDPQPELRHRERKRNMNLHLRRVDSDKRNLPADLCSDVLAKDRRSPSIPYNIGHAATSATAGSGLSFSFSVKRY